MVHPVANGQIRGTDAGGLFVDTTITVDVVRDNAAPEIINFIPSYVGGGTWILSGDVVDADDDVSNFIVEFSGVYTTRSAVDENGHFEFAIILDEVDWGWEYAITYDSHGAQSNEPFTDIGIT